MEKQRLFRNIRNYTMPVIAFSLSLGIFLATHTREGAWPWVLVVLGILVLLMPFRRNFGLAMGILFCAAGLLWAQQWLYPTSPQEGAYAVAGRVYGEPTVRTESRVTFLLGQVTLNGEVQPGKAYCTLYVYGNEELPMLFDGAQVQFRGRVYHPSGKSRAHDFDFRMWMYQNRLHYGITGIQSLQVENTPETASWYDVASRVRVGMRNALTKVMGEEARLAMAIMVSDREGLREDENQAFQKAGIAHVMAVSGLHMAIVSGAMLLLLERLRVRRSLQLVLVSSMMLAYCMVSGFSAAAVRATVMAALVLLAKRVRRKPDPLITLSVAAMLVLLWNPLQLFSAGFVLSFSAVSGIFLFYPVLLQGMGRGRKTAYKRRALERTKPKSTVFSWLLKGFGHPAEILAVSLSAQLGVLLPTAAYFHMLPSYGVLINMLIVPFIGILLPLYFVTLALSPLPYLGLGIGWLARQGTRGLLWLVRLLADLPYASIRVASAPVSIVCGAVLCGVLASRYFRGKRKVRLAAIGITVVVALAGAYLLRPPELRYIQLSVGQADAALLMDGKSTIAIDVGEFGTATSDYLLAEGRNLDALFLSHLHRDHAFGVNDLLDMGIAIKQIYLPEGAKRQQLDEAARALLVRLAMEGIPVTELAAGQEVRYNRIALKTLWPWEGKVRPGQDANHFSLALAIDFDGYTIFSAGDLTGEYENYAAIPCDVLKVSHHGSGGSTGEVFLSTTSPRLALISSGAGERRLPSPETLKRLENRNIPFYRTDETGDITLTVRDGKLWLTTYKERVWE